MKIGLTSIFVNDPDQAFIFYTSIFGFAKRLYIPEARLAIVVSAEDPDGTGLLLGPNDNPMGKTYQEALFKASLPAIVFATQDIQKEYERLMKLGVVFRKAPTKTHWGTEALFEDGCGNIIQLHQV